MSAEFDHRLPEVLAEFQQVVRRFAREEVAPVIGGYYERGELPYEVIAKMAAMGLFGLPFPEEYGGMDAGPLALPVALEELARVDSSVAVTLEAAISLSAMLIFRFGNEEQKSAFLPPLVAGKKLAAFALTEPGGGSDAAALKTVARRDGAEFVLNGTKAFITNSGTDITSLLIVAAVTGTRAGGRSEISSFIVPADTPGLIVGKKYSKVGWLASDTHEVALVDCRVPAENLLGPEGRGYAQFLEVLDEGRIGVAAMAVGLAQGCIDESVRYCSEREAFGHRIGEYQAIRFKIADMEARAHTARLAYLHAASKHAHGEPYKKEAAIAKLVASDAAVLNAREATQIFGGYGFVNDTPVGRFWRDAKILEIGEGTSEVLRMLISRELGVGEPGPER
jgi:alkylation response protein AidB-like acyl-CoA dehydrogenase